MIWPLIQWNKYHNFYNCNEYVTHKNGTRRAYKVIVLNICTFSALLLVATEYRLATATFAALLVVATKYRLATPLLQLHLQHSCLLLESTDLLHPCCSYICNTLACCYRVQTCYTLAAATFAALLLVAREYRLATPLLQLHLQHSCLLLQSTDLLHPCCSYICGTLACCYRVQTCNTLAAATFAALLLVATEYRLATPLLQLHLQHSCLLLQSTDLLHPCCSYICGTLACCYRVQTCYTQLYYTFTTLFLNICFTFLKSS